jgi:hypothetical protein
VQDFPTACVQRMCCTAFYDAFALGSRGISLAAWLLFRMYSARLRFKLKEGSKLHG